MIDTVSETLRRLLVRWVDGVRRATWAVVLASVAVTALAGWYFAANVRIDTDTEDMLSPELAFREDSRALAAAFPQFSDNLVVVVEGATPDLADDAARALVERLRARPELFGPVFDPASHPFFRRNGLLYLDAEELQDLADRLAEAQPFLGALWRDPSLRGLFEMLGRAIDETLEGGSGVSIEIATALESVAAVAEAQADGRFRHLSWHDLMMGADDAPGADRRVFTLQPALDFASLEPAARAIGAIRDLARELRLTPDRGVRVRLTGSAALAQEELQSVEAGMGLAAGLSLALVLGLLVVGLRSARLVIATLATLLMGLVWTAAFAIAALGRLNLISVAFAVLFIGLSVDFGIHFALRYREAQHAGAAHGGALREAAASVGGALALCALTAAIGFYAFLPTDYLGLAELGLIAGTGMFVAFFSNITVLPALLGLMPPRAAPAGPPRRPGGDGLGAAQRFVRDHARAVLALAAVLAVISAALVPGARFDFDPMNLRDPDTESVATIRDLTDAGQGGRSVAVLADSLDEARRLAERLDRLAPVDETETLLDYVPANQERKLETIGTMALFLAPSLMATEPEAAPTPAETRDAVAALRARLRRLAAGAPGGALGDGARRLEAALAALFGGSRPEAEVLREMHTRLLAGLPGRLEALRDALAAEPVTRESLPEALRERMVAADGRARLEVRPRDDITDRAALVRFVDAVRTVAPDATGSAVVILEAGNAVVAAFREAAAIALACIALLLAALLRNLRDVLFIFAPLALAALLTVAVSAVFGPPFNFANVIVLPLLFGLGVASGIHLVLRERKERGAARALRTSTPRAVVFSALTTIGSFGSIALSNHPGTASMGILLTVAIALTLASTLLVLPALMAVRPRGAGGAGAP